MWTWRCRGVGRTHSVGVLEIGPVGGHPWPRKKQQRSRRCSRLLGSVRTVRRTPRAVSSRRRWCGCGRYAGIDGPGPSACVASSEHANSPPTSFSRRAVASSAQHLGSRWTSLVLIPATRMVWICPLSRCTSKVSPSGTLITLPDQRRGAAAPAVLVTTGYSDTMMTTTTRTLSLHMGRLSTLDFIS